MSVSSSFHTRVPVALIRARHIFTSLKTLSLGTTTCDQGSFVNRCILSCNIVADAFHVPSLRGRLWPWTLFMDFSLEPHQILLPVTQPRIIIPSVLWPILLGGGPLARGATPYLMETPDSDGTLTRELTLCHRQAECAGKGKWQCTGDETMSVPSEPWK